MDKKMNEEQLSALLQKLPQEKLPEGFSFSLRQKLREEVDRQEREEQRPGNHWQEVILHVIRQPVFALAAAAVIVFMVVSPMFVPRPGSISVALYDNPSNKMEVGQVALLRVEFRAAQDIDDVTFKVELPDGVMFVSAHDVIESSRALAFHGDVKKQQSIVMPVAVRVLTEGPQEISVKASKMGKKKIVLEGTASID